MCKVKKEVMPSSKKGTEAVEVMPAAKRVASNPILKRFVNHIPTYEEWKTMPNAIYYVNDPGLIKHFTSVCDGIDLNRGIKRKHVNEIKKDILAGDVDYMIPICVDIRTHECGQLSYEGNHRIIAYREAWEEGSLEYLPIMFNELPVDIIEKHRLIKKINNSQDGWKSNDYSESLMNLGNTHMIKIRDFIDKHPLCQGKQKTSYRLATCFIYGKNSMKNIIDETIEVTDEIMENAEFRYKDVERIYNVMEQTRPNFQKNNWLESFVCAWYDIKNDASNQGTMWMLNEMGMDTYLKYLPMVCKDWQFICRKSYWEGEFRASIFKVYEMAVLNK